MPRKPNDTVQLKLRFEEALRARLEKAARKNNRSMNTEILVRLRQSFYTEDLNDMMQATATATATAVFSQFHVAALSSKAEAQHTHTMPPDAVVGNTHTVSAGHTIKPRDPLLPMAPKGKKR